MNLFEQRNLYGNTEKPLSNFVLDTGLKQIFKVEFINNIIKINNVEINPESYTQYCFIEDGDTLDMFSKMIQEYREYLTSINKDSDDGWDDDINIAIDDEETDDETLQNPSESKEKELTPVERSNKSLNALLTNYIIKDTSVGKLFETDNIDEENKDKIYEQLYEDVNRECDFTELSKRNIELVFNPFGEKSVCSEFNKNEFLEKFDTGDDGFLASNLFFINRGFLSSSNAKLYPIAYGENYCIVREKFVTEFFPVNILIYKDENEDWRSEVLENQMIASTNETDNYGENLISLNQVCNSAEYFDTLKGFLSKLTIPFFNDITILKALADNHLVLNNKSINSPAKMGSLVEKAEKLITDSMRHQIYIGKYKINDTLAGKFFLEDNNLDDLCFPFDFYIELPAASYSLLMSQDSDKILEMIRGIDLNNNQWNYYKMKAKQDLASRETILTIKM